MSEDGYYVPFLPTFPHCMISTRMFMNVSRIPFFLINNVFLVSILFCSTTLYLADNNMAVHCMLMCQHIASIHCRKHAKIYSYVHNIQNICNTFCVCVCELLLVSIRTSKCHPAVLFIGDIPALANTHLFNTHKMWSCCSTNIRKLFRMSSQRISGTFP